MSVIIGLPCVDTSELIFPKNTKLRQLVEKLDHLGYTVTSENHIALCLLLAGIANYDSVQCVKYEKGTVRIIADKDICLDLSSVRLLARGMKRFVIDDGLRYYARKLANDLLKQDETLLFVNRCPRSHAAPMVTIPDLETKKRQNSLIKTADTVVSLADFMEDPLRFLKTSNLRLRNFSNNQRQSHLGLFLPAAAFDKRRFPRHDLMQSLKARVRLEVGRMIAQEDWQLDRLDLEYQTLFRLTTYLPTELYLHPGIVDYESKDLTYNSTVVGYYNTLSYKTGCFNHELIRRIIREQALIILRRLQKSHLPVELFLKDRFLSEEDRPSLHKTKEGLFAVDRYGVRKRVLFMPVDLAVARRIHNDFHYIHAPRADMAFGLYYENEEYPFSVVALEKIDRSYKKIALAMFGYDAENCLDFTRLYSRPGGPKNASSVIFRELKVALRYVMPNIQAGISTHMPTYTHGNSMLAGGFDTPFLLKENIHSFIGRKIKDEVCYEMLTNRRLSRSATASVLTTRLPLLPVVELIAPFNRPRVQPRFEIGKTMLLRRLSREGT